MSRDTNLIEIANRIHADVAQFKSHFPTLADEQVLHIVGVIVKRNPAPEAPPTAVVGPPTLAAAVAVILKESGQASRGEIYRALAARGWAKHLANGREIYGVLGRVLEGPHFEKVHRGMYRLALASEPTPKPKVPADLVPDHRRALLAAMKLSQPFYTRDLDAVLQIGIFQVAAYLKALKQRGLVKHALTEVNGTHLWTVV